MDSTEKWREGEKPSCLLLLDDFRDCGDSDRLKYQATKLYVEKKFID
jgi:hypothetical protein